MAYLPTVHPRLNSQQRCSHSTRGVEIKGVVPARFSPQSRPYLEWIGCSGGVPEVVCVIPLWLEARQLAAKGRNPTR